MVGAFPGGGEARGCFRGEERAKRVVQLPRSLTDKLTYANTASLQPGNLIVRAYVPTYAASLYFSMGFKLPVSRAVLR